MVLVNSELKSTRRRVVCPRCRVPLTVRGTQALVSFAPLAFKSSESWLASWLFAPGASAGSSFSWAAKAPVLSSTGASETPPKARNKKSSAAAAAKKKDTLLHSRLRAAAGPGQRPPQRRRQRAVRRAIELVERAARRREHRRVAPSAARHQRVQPLHGGDARRPPVVERL